MILVIYCCGGYGREILVLANRINKIKHRWNEVIFADDNLNASFLVENRVLTFEQIKTAYDKLDCEFVIASGEPYFLKLLSNKVLDNGYNLTNLIAGDVRTDSNLQIKPGCIIQEKATITCNVKIGMSASISFSTVLHHDVNIKDYCFVAANSTLCGNVTVGESTYIGAGSVIKDEINIGSNCIIGMGSAVAKDVPDNSVAYGNPAKVIRCKTEQMVFK